MSSVERLSSGRWLLRRLEGLLGWVDYHRSLGDELDAATASADESGASNARRRLAESLSDGLSQIDALLGHLSPNDRAIRERADDQLRAQLSDALHALGTMRVILQPAQLGLQWRPRRIPQRRDLETTGQRGIPPDDRDDHGRQLDAAFALWADRIEDWESAENSLRDLLNILRGTGEDNTISQWKSECPDVRKPAGWTKGELAKVASISEGTFDQIRGDAHIKSAERGGKGAQRRFTPEELSVLIKAAQSSGFPKRIKAAEEWAKLRG